MTNLDDLLGRLGAEETPRDLEDIDSEVLRRVSSHGFGREPEYLRAGLVGLALTMGLAGGLLSNSEARAGAATMTIDGADLAPSTLLAGR